MTRFLLQIFSIPLAFAVGLFYWVGMQTFGGSERVVANIVFTYCAVLLVLAFGNLFTARLFAAHAIMTVGALLIIAATFTYAELYPAAH